MGSNLEKMREYRKENKEALNKYDRERNRTDRRRYLKRKYYNMQMRTFGKGLRESGAKGKPLMTWEEFWQFYLDTQEQFERMWNDWIESGESILLRITVDRIKSDKGYENGNIQWLTQSANSSKGNRDINEFSF